MIQTPSVLDLMKSGAHFGHQSSRWHPKMQPFIFGIRNGIHVIDLEKTIVKLEEAQKFINKVVSSGGKILFLGTKKQVQTVIKTEADRCGMPYLNARWIGGFLTNFSIVSRLADKYKSLVKKREGGELDKYTKKEKLDFEKEIKILEANVYGIKDMPKLPDAIFVWDVKKEKTAIAEAKKKNIPLIGICDTNVSPDGIDYVIPVNDDATKTIELISAYIADCVLDAKNNMVKPEDKKNEVKK